MECTNLKPQDVYTLYHCIDYNIDEWWAHYQTFEIYVEHTPASFDAIDMNHDGLISKEEFYAYHHEFYSSTEDTLHSSILYGALDYHNIDLKLIQTSPALCIRLVLHNIATLSVVQERLNNK